jgi:hypothetical protein
MPYKFQLKDAQNDIGLQNVAGYGSASPQFIQLVNEAQRRLMKRGDFFGLTQEAILVFQGCYVVWPKYIGTILGARRGHRGGVQVANQWYSFTGSWHRHHCHWHGDAVLEDAGETCLFSDITGSTLDANNSSLGQIVQYYVQAPQDLGATITLYGKQYGEQPLQQFVNGAWQRGLTLTAATPVAQTTVNVTEISSIIRSPTQGNATLYEYDVATNTRRLLAVFEPNDTNPRFRRSCIVNFNNCFGCNPNNSTVPKYHQLDVLVKLEFIPVVNPWDFLLIDDFDALKFAIQAIKAEEAGDIQTANQFFLRAIAELNMRDRDKMPTWETPVAVQPLMGRRIVNPN